MFDVGINEGVSGDNRWLGSRFSVFLKISVFLSILPLSSCIPVATSPFVYPLDSSSTLEQNCVPIVLVVDKSATESLLGFQFVLGVFPLTRLYSLEPTEVLVEKELTTYLRELGYCVYRTNAKHSKEVLVSHQARYVLRLSDVNLSATAYDLLFVRRLSVSGSMSLGVLRDLQVEPVSLHLDFSQSEFAQSGFSYRLVALLQSALKTSFRDDLDFLLTNFPGREKRCVGSFPGIFIAPPSISKNVSEQYPKLEGDFKTGLPALGWEAEIRSRVMGGFIHTLESEPLVWSDSSSQHNNCTQWRISSLIEQMNWDGRMMEVIALFELSSGYSTVAKATEAKATEAKTTVAKTRCRIKEPLEERNRKVALLGVGRVLSKVLSEFYYKSSATDGQPIDGSDRNIQCEVLNQHSGDRIGASS